MSKINPYSRDFVILPGITPETRIATRQMFDGLNYYDSHEAAAEHGLFMSDPFQFIVSYLLKLKIAALGKLEMRYGDGTTLSKGDAINLYNELTHHAWGFLNGKFKQGKNGLLIVKTTYMENGRIIQKQRPLESCLKGNSFAELSEDSFNEQGLPIKATNETTYDDENGVRQRIYFFPPMVGFVPRFSADRDGVDFYCYAGSGVSDSALGSWPVFIAEGAAEKIPFSTLDERLVILGEAGITDPE